METTLTQGTPLSPGTKLVSNLARGEYVFVRSETFGGEFGGYVHEFIPGQPFFSVRLDLPDDHPAMQDVLADNPDLSPDAAELFDIVSADEIFRTNGRPVRVWQERQPEDSAEERAARHWEQNRPRVSLPDLDAGLRNPIRRLA